jgi:signal transduction histidine kinase
VSAEDGTVIPRERMPFERALAGEPVVFEVELYDHVWRGTLTLRTRTTPLRDSSNAIIGAVKVAVDVTKENELARVKDEFIRQAAHELKTPIALIKAKAEVALTEGAAPTQQLEGVVRGVDRMDGLINSLLDLLDIQGGLFSFSRFPVALERVLAGAIQRLPERAAQRVRITASTSSRVQCDEARLRRAISSLIDNSLKYSPPSTPVRVRGTRSAPQIPRISRRPYNGHNWIAPVQFPSRYGNADQRCTSTPVVSSPKRSRNTRVARAQHTCESGLCAATST